MILIVVMIVFIIGTLLFQFTKTLWNFLYAIVGYVIFAQENIWILMLIFVQNAHFIAVKTATDIIKVKEQMKNKSQN